MTDFIVKFAPDGGLEEFEEGQIRLSKESTERWGITNRNFVYYSANVDDSVLISDGLNPNDFEKVSDFLYFEYKDGGEFIAEADVLKRRSL